MLFWGATGLGALLLAALALQVGLRLTQVSVARQAPEALSEMISPFYRVIRPEGDGPFPTALLASGCDGPKDNLARWAEALNRAGWAAVVVDSHGPRGLTADPMWRLVCAGALLPGGARAGDLAVALADIRRMSFVDPERLGLIGASHGGWAVLDLLALADRGRRPENLRRWPAAPGNDPLHGVVAVAALYPYCGPASRVRRAGWQRDVPVLIVSVAEDTIVPEADCLAVAERAEAAGLPVTVSRFSGVTHGFDQQEKSVLTTLRYDAEATARLSEQLERFFADAGERSAI